MATPRCPIGVRELKRRQHNLRAHIGRQIHDLRVEAGISQAHLAAAAGIDQGHLSRIERGLIQARLDTLVAIAACLGADFGARLFAGVGPRLTDRFQAPIVEALIAILDKRWIRFPELAVPKARGFIDVAIGDRRADVGVAAEIHSELRSLDVIQRRLVEKALAVAEMGIVGSNVSTLLVVRSTKANRDTVRLFEATLSAAFPSRMVEALEALRGPDAPWPGRTILWARLESGRAEILDRPPRGVRVGR